MTFKPSLTHRMLLPRRISLALLLWGMAGFLPPGSFAQETPDGAVTEGGVVFYINPDVYGKSDLSGLTVWAFSQCGNQQEDPQVLELSPDIVPRVWNKWDRWGIKVSDYNFSYPADYKAKGIVFIAGGTATVFFPDEAASDEEFKAQVSVDAKGQSVKPPGGFYRGSLASEAFRQRLISFSEIQIDGGVDGLFFDEVNSSYDGAHWAGDGGFDDADVSDFGHYLCLKHPRLGAAQWEKDFGLKKEDHLDCAGGGGSFDYRGYLKRNGWDSSPLSPANPLEKDWGHTLENRPDPDEGTFTQDYPSLVYWQQIVLTLRSYARQKYGKEILITSNGIFPFVDFQSVGLYDYNHDGPGGEEVNYVPTQEGHLDGTQSLQDAFKGLKARSLRIARREVPLSLFLDWPTPSMDRYNALPQKEREDYWRLYAAEAYANGLYFAFHLKTTTGEPTATQGMMPFFKSYTAFFRRHAGLYHGAEDLPDRVTLSQTGIVSNLVRLPSGDRVLHLINHHYSRGFQVLHGLTVQVPISQPPHRVTRVSPDEPSDQEVSFQYIQGSLRLKLDRLTAYSALVVH